MCADHLEQYLTHRNYLNKFIREWWFSWGHIGTSRMGRLIIWRLSKLIFFFYLSSCLFSEGRRKQISFNNYPIQNWFTYIITETELILAGEDSHNICHISVYFSSVLCRFWTRRLVRKYIERCKTQKEKKKPLIYSTWHCTLYYLVWELQLNQTSDC